MNGPTINFGWRSRSDITDEEAAQIGQRALGLGCHVHVMLRDGDDPPQWSRVEAFDPNLRVKSPEHVILEDGIRTSGESYNLAVAMNLALDKYEIELDERTWTPEELVQIAAQSGMAVSRG